jgi:anion-transporting  ArsA/GET3 family ATPase
MFGGFRERAQQTYDMLKTPGTAFLVVAVPEPDALREASYFADRLAEEQMPLAGLVLNRVHASAAPQLSAERSLSGAQTLEESGTAPVAAAVLRVHAERVRLGQREARLADRFTAAHPEVPVVPIPALATDVHDLTGLRSVGRQAAAG